MKGLRRSLLMIVAVSGLLAEAAAQDSASVVPTNMHVYQSLAASLADSAARLIAMPDSARVTVKVAPADVAWFLQDAVERVFRTRGFTISSNDSGGYGMEFGAAVMAVRYANVRRDGMFGPRVLDRVVVLTARLRLTDRVRGSVVLTGERTAEFGDAIPLSRVEQIEYAAIPSTRGTIPPEDFFSGIIEPLVIVGALAVAIFLLITVRS